MAHGLAGRAAVCLEFARRGITLARVSEGVEMTSRKNDTTRAIVNRVPAEEPELEDLPREWDAEDQEIEGRKPDLGEIEEDPSEL
jgi:hypothetical protein